MTCSRLVNEAMWQGLVYPNQWGEKEALKLLHDLGAMNNHGLVASLLEAMPQLEQRRYHVRRLARQSERKKEGAN